MHVETIESGAAATEPPSTEPSNPVTHASLTIDFDRTFLGRPVWIESIEAGTFGTGGGLRYWATVKAQRAGQTSRYVAYFPLIEAGDGVVDDASYRVFFKAGAGISRSVDLVDDLRMVVPVHTNCSSRVDATVFRPVV